MITIQSSFLFFVVFFFLKMSEFKTWEGMAGKDPEEVKAAILAENAELEVSLGIIMHNMLCSLRSLNTAYFFTIDSSHFKCQIQCFD